MKKIYKLALTELQTLFYLPVAWLILVIFLFQVGMTYCSILEPKVMPNFSTIISFTVDATSDIIFKF